MADETPKVPEPVVVRGAILAVVALVGAITGKALDISWLDEALAVYAVTAPVVLSLWARLYVSPVKGRHAK
ncbi:hypothetical protein ACWF99_23470 [Nocardia sp. NPDC055002]